MEASILVLVVGIVLLVALINIAVWVPLVRRLRRMPVRLREELRASGEQVVAGPESCVYRGSNGIGLPRMMGSGVIALTERRLVFRRAIGGPADVPVSRIAGVREDRWFLGGARGGRIHVIVVLRDGGEVGFYVHDNAAWTEAIRAAVAS